MKSPALFLTLTLACGATFAAGSDQPAAAYAYGMALDVAEVLAIREGAHGRCEPVPTELTYRDSQGQVKTVSYLKADMSCE